MRRILVMVRKEFRQIFRDRPMMAIIFLMPVVQLLVLSFAITTEVKHVDLVVVDLDNGAVSREIVRAFANTDRFDLRPAAGGLASIEDGMRGWEAQVGLVIPPGFGRDLARGLRPQAGLVMDGVDGNAASVAMGYAAGILSGAVAPPAGRLRPAAAVAMRERMWFNPDLDSKDYMVPAIVVVLLTILPLMLSAMSLVKEKEIGTLEQLLVTPLGKRQLLAGKLAPFLVLSYAELAVVTTVAVLVFGIRMNGSYLDLAAAAFVYLATTIGLGIFVSTITGTQQQAMFVAWFFVMFMILMSGFFIPIENMPAGVRALTLLDPMRYFVSIVRDVFQKGTPLCELWRDLAPMAVFGAGIFTLGTFSFRKRVG
ncbi:MAG: ABC transporter permease [Candidatus Krumholzibacteriota bacterium]|nr:ABC transporter permease [Candidatus Krumholzibacteriota bacterium]